MALLDSSLLLIIFKSMNIAFVNSLFVHCEGFMTSSRFMHMLGLVEKLLDNF